MEKVRVFESTKKLGFFFIIRVQLIGVEVLRGPRIEIGYSIVKTVLLGTLS